MVSRGTKRSYMGCLHKDKTVRVGLIVNGSDSVRVAVELRQIHHDRGNRWEPADLEKPDSVGLSRTQH